MPFALNLAVAVDMDDNVSLENDANCISRALLLGLTKKKQMG
jgi:hypothetical protein